jgi:hypothetical protein
MSQDFYTVASVLILAWVLLIHFVISHVVGPWLRRVRKRLSLEVAIGQPQALGRAYRIASRLGIRTARGQIPRRGHFTSRHERQAGRGQIPRSEVKRPGLQAAIRQIPTISGGGSWVP